MENQVQELVEKKFPAAALHSELDNRQHWQTLRSHSQNQLSFLGISPQTLLSPTVMGVRSLPLLQEKSLDIALIKSCSYKIPHLRVGWARCKLLMTVYKKRLYKPQFKVDKVHQPYLTCGSSRDNK